MLFRSDEPHARRCSPEGLPSPKSPLHISLTPQKVPLPPLRLFPASLEIYLAVFGTLRNCGTIQSLLGQIVSFLVIWNIRHFSCDFVPLQIGLSALESLQIAEGQATTCCPALSGLWGASLAEMKSTAYVDYGAKTQFAP